MQVTRDGHPVAFQHQRLPEDAFDLSVADVTLAQFEMLASRTGLRLDLSLHHPATLQEWKNAISGSMVSVQLLMQVRHLTEFTCCLEMGPIFLFALDSTSRI